MDFRKAFDSVSHEILVKKVECNFGTTEVLLDRIQDNLSGRMQFTVLNGVKSDMLPVKTCKPQGSVLCPILFTLFANDLPAAITMGSLFMYADDTSIFCIGESVDAAIASLNRALQEVYWRETEVKFSFFVLFFFLKRSLSGVKICLSHTQIGLL